MKKTLIIIFLVKNYILKMEIYRISNFQFEIFFPPREIEKNLKIIRK